MVKIKQLSQDFVSKWNILEERFIKYPQTRCIKIFDLSLFNFIFLK